MPGRDLSNKILITIMVVMIVIHNITLIQLASNSNLGYPFINIQEMYNINNKLSPFVIFIELLTCSFSPISKKQLSLATFINRRIWCFLLTWDKLHYHPLHEISKKKKVQFTCLTSIFGSSLSVLQEQGSYSFSLTKCFITGWKLFREKPVILKKKINCMKLMLKQQVRYVYHLLNFYVEI